MINIKKPLDLRYRHLIPQRIREYAFYLYDSAITQSPVDRNLQLYVTLLAHAEHLLREAPPNSLWWKETNKYENKRKALDLLRDFHDWEENPQKTYEKPADRESDRKLLLTEYIKARNSSPYTSSDEWENKFRRLEKCPAPFFLTFITDNHFDDEIAALKKLCSSSGDELPEIQLLPDDCGLSLENLSDESRQRFLGANIDDYDLFYSGEGKKCEWWKRNNDDRFILFNNTLLADFEDRFTLRPVFVTEYCQNISSLQQEIEQGEINYLLEELKHLVGIKELNAPDGWSLVNNELQLRSNCDYHYTCNEQIASFSTTECLGALHKLLSVNRVKSQVFGDAVWTAPVGGYTIPWRSNWSKLANRDIYIFKFGECTSEELARQLLDVAAAIVRDIGADNATRIEAATKLNFVIMPHKIYPEASKNDIQLLDLDQFFKEYVSDNIPVPEALKSVHEDYLRRSKRKSQNPYIVEPVIRRNSWCLLTGEEGTGKTYFGIALGAAIAGNGSLFWDWKVRRRNCKILYITDDEMSEEVIQDRLSVLKRRYPSSKKRFFVEQVRHLSLLDDEENSQKTDKETGKEKVEKLLLKYSRKNDDSPVEVLFLDHLLKLSEAEGDQKTHWPKIRSWIEDLTRRGLSVVLLHHEYGGGKMLGTRLIANDTPARIHLQPLHTLKPRTKSEREECEYSDEDFELGKDEIGFGLSIIKNRGGRDQKEPRILKLDIGKYPRWYSPDDKNSHSEPVETPPWKVLNKAERLSCIRKLRNEGRTNVEIAKKFNRSMSCIEKYVALLSDTEKHYKGPKPQNRRDPNKTSTDPVSPTDHKS